MKTSETLYCAMDVAASIIRCSNRIGYGINYLHLQKLLYFVQAYSFILYGKPIFIDDIYATTYGAHVPDVAQYYRKFGGQIIGNKNIKANIYRKVRDKDLDMIKKVILHFQDKTSVELTKIIYKHKPWKDAIDSLSNLITKESLRDYFYHPEKEFKDRSKKSESKPKRYRIKPSIVRNFFAVCTMITCIVLGFRIDCWICQNVNSPFAVFSLILKTITFLTITHNIVNDDHEDLEDAVNSVEEKLRSGIFEEID